MSKAIVKNYRQSPQKVRLIADSIRGKKVTDAITQLQFMAKRGASPMKKIVESALANAKNNSVPTENLIIKEITVDQGVTLKRWRPKWRGTAHPIRKRTSNVVVILGEKVAKVDKKSKSEKSTKKVEKVEEKPENVTKEAPAKKKVTKKSVTKIKK